MNEIIIGEIYSVHFGPSLGHNMALNIFRSVDKPSIKPNPSSISSTCMKLMAWLGIAVYNIINCMRNYLFRNEFKPTEKRRTYMNFALHVYV